MSYRDLVCPWNRPDVEFQVLEVEVVACIQPQTDLLCLPGCGKVRRDCLLRPQWILFGISGGVQLDPVGTAGRGTLDHGGIGIDEYGGADALRSELLAHVGEKVPVRERVPAGVGSDGIVGVRHQGDLVRNHFAHEVDKTWNRISLYVEFGLYSRPDFPDIGISYVPFVRPGMDCDALGSEILAVSRRLFDVWHVPAAGIPYGRNLVDVDT